MKPSRRTAITWCTPRWPNCNPRPIPPCLPAPGTIQTNPAGVWGTPNPGARPLSQEYRATVEYRLYRSGNPDAISSAPFSNRQMTSETEVVAQIMNQIANRVFAEVKKAPPPQE